MDKLRNIISPGHAEDDQRLYGSGESSGTNPATAASKETRNITDDARAMEGGSPNMPGGFVSTPQEESQRNLGGSSTGHSTASGNMQPSSTHHVPATATGTGGIGHDTRTGDAPIATARSTDHRHPTGGITHQPGATSTSTTNPLTSQSSAPASSRLGADDAASTTSIKSGIPGNTSHVSPTGTSTHSAGVGPNTGLSSTGTHPGHTTHSTRDPLASTTSGTGPTSSTGHVQDPPFSNRTLHSSGSHPTTTSSSHHGTEALAGAGLGAAGYEAGRHHDSRGHTGSQGISSAQPLGGSTGATSHSSGIGGPTGTHVPGSTTHGGLGSTGAGPTTHGGLGSSGAGPTTHGGLGSTGAGPTTHGGLGSVGTGSTTHGGLGSSGVGTDLADRSRPHADIGPTTTDRSFPLGGHVGEGPHSVTTANRLDPRIPDTGEEFRRGTHRHGDTGYGATGAGLGAGALAGEQAREHGHHGHHHDPTSTHHAPSSGLTGSSTTGTSAVSGGSSTHPSHGHHLGRDAAVGTGAAGAGALGAHELGTRHGAGQTGAISGSHPTTTTGGGVTGSGGKRYDTLASGTPSGVSTRDPAAHSHIGRDVGGAGALGAGAVGAHELEKKHGTHPTGTHHTGALSGSQPTTTSGGIPGSGGKQYDTLTSGTPSGVSTRDPAAHSHLGRDVGGAGALGAGAVGAHELEKKHGTHHTGGVPGSQPTTTAGGLGGAGGHTYNTLGDNTASGISTRDPAAHSHHLGRDAAAGGAGVAGTGLAAHELGKSHGADHKPTMTSGKEGKPGYEYSYLSDGTPSGIKVAEGTGQTSRGISGQDHGHHVSHVPGVSSTHPETTSRHTHETTGHHVGRDVGLGAAGAGAAGTAGYEYEKHKGHPSSNVPRAAEDRSAGATINHRPVQGYEGPQAIPGERGVGPSSTSTAANRAQESLSRHPDQTTGHHGHAGRDTAAAAGVGGAGTAAAYEAEKGKHSATHPTSGTHHTTSDARGSDYVGRHPELAPDYREPAAGVDPSKHHGHQHAGRDTTAVAGGSAVAHEADKKHKHEHEHAQKGAEEKKPGLLDKILHPSKAKEEERQYEEAKAVHDPKHHTGEKAAVGTTAASGLGGAEAHQQSRGDPHYGTERSSNLPGSGVHGTEPFQPHTGVDSRQAGPTGTVGQAIDPRVDTPAYGQSQHGSGYAGDTVSPVNKTQAGTTYQDPSLAAHGEGRHSGGASGILHRDQPNKLHKDPPTH